MEKGAIRFPDEKGCKDMPVILDKRTRMFRIFQKTVGEIMLFLQVRPFNAIDNGIPDGIQKAAKEAVCKIFEGIGIVLTLDKGRMGKRAQFIKLKIPLSS